MSSRLQPELGRDLYQFTDSVQLTLSEALISKHSACRHGYFDDQALMSMVPPSVARRRSPLIHRGYYSRVVSLRTAMLSFLDGIGPTKDYQILVLGSGYDMNYVWLRDFLIATSGEESARHLHWYEVDFPNVVDRKLHLLRELDTFGDDETVINTNDGNLREAVGRFNAVGYDLRDAWGPLRTKLLEQGLDPSRPTVVLLECVLIYLEASAGNLVLEGIPALIDGTEPLMLLQYEQVRPDDPFGQAMCEHLALRSCPLRSIRHFPTPDAQQERLISAGFQEAVSSDMNFFFDRVLRRSDTFRIEQLELFDEIEEWRLIQAHYTIVVGLGGNMKHEAVRQVRELLKGHNSQYPVAITSIRVKELGALKLRETMAKELRESDVTGEGLAKEGPLVRAFWERLFRTL